MEEELNKLRAEIDALRSNKTVAQSYLALKKYIDENNRLMVSMNMTTLNMKDKDDKLAERANKYSTDILNHIKRLQELERMATIELIQEEEKTYGGSLEEALNG